MQPPAAASPGDAIPRRAFLNRCAWGCFSAALGGYLFALLRFLFPRVVFEPPTAFKAGFPDEYPPGVISQRWKREHRLWIIRLPAGLIALSAKCTHLGCTPNWLEVESKFKCPCHGSGFYRDGVNFEGPAPRPLERFRVLLADDGQILVDKGKSFRQDKGEWQDPESILKV